MRVWKRQHQEVTPLRKRRLVIGKTQGDVARDARITKATVSLYESGQRMPHPRRIMDLAHALQLNTEQLVELLTSR